MCLCCSGAAFGTGGPDHLALPCLTCFAQPGCQMIGQRWGLGISFSSREPGATCCGGLCSWGPLYSWDLFCSLYLFFCCCVGDSMVFRSVLCHSRRVLYLHLLPIKAMRTSPWMKRSQTADLSADQSGGDGRSGVRVNERTFKLTQWYTYSICCRD